MNFCHKTIFYIFLVLGICSGIAFACSCFAGTPKQNYCNAGWVSRVKIIKKTLTPIPQQTGTNNGGANFGVLDPSIAAQMMDVNYYVEHVKIYKTSHDLKNQLPKAIITASNSGVCGIEDLVPGEEYLLAGMVEENTLRINSCGQIGPVGGFGVQEWKNVSLPQKADLDNNKYEPCTTTTPFPIQVVTASIIASANIVIAPTPLNTSRSIHNVSNTTVKTL